MANLIPPDAKKDIVIEYWLRVATIWCILLACAIVVVALLKIPTFVLVHSQLRAFSGAYDSAKEKEISFNEAQDIIISANQLSTLLAAHSTTTTGSEIVDILDDIAGSGVTISSYNITWDDMTMSAVLISGQASTRLALSNFSKDIEAHPLFEEADLPISNLAKDRDIPFNITIIPSSS